MKLKHLLTTFSFFIAITLVLMSCSKDDKFNDYVESDLAGTYVGANFSLNGKEAPKETTLIIQSKGNGKAVVKLTNDIIGYPEIVFDNVEFKSASNQYTFDFVDKNVDRDITFTGTIKDKKVVSTSEVKFNTDLIGKWELKRGNRTSPTVLEAYFIFNIVSKTEEGKAMDATFNAMLPTAIGQLLAKSVDVVTLNFSTSGSLIITYKTPVEEGGTTLPVDLGFKYFIKDGKMHFAFAKGLIDVLPQFMPNVDLNKIKELLTDTGAYYSLVLNTTAAKDYKEFYIDQSLTSKIAPIAVGLIPKEGIPDFMDKEDLVELVDYVGGAESLKIGLGFDRIK